MLKRIVSCALAAALLASAAQNARALVGISQPGGAATAHTVMVLAATQRGPGNCSGVVIAPRTILTAAHCVTPALGVLIHVSPQLTPSPLRAARIAVHPGYVADAIRKRVRSIDLALVQTESALPAQIRPAPIGGGESLLIGQRFVVAGFGVRHEGGPLNGELRSGVLRARAPLGSIILWAEDDQDRGLGACVGDSGGPIFDASVSHVSAITVWAAGASGRKCGNLTQGVLLAPQRGWIEKTLQQWGAK